MSSHPDADIHPTATGLAKKLVDAHQEPQNLVLYAGWFCPFVQRTWIVLEEKKIPYQYVEVNPYHKPESLLKLNPRGLVPTLEYDGKPLYESTVIAEFLEDAYPDHGKQLRPNDVYQRAYGRIWSDFITSRIIPKYFKFIQHDDKASYTLDEARKDFLNSLKEFTKAMDTDGPFFFGKEPMMVDFLLAPWEQRLWPFDHFKQGGLGIPKEGQGGEDDKTWIRWKKWQKAIQERDSVKNTTSEREYLLPIYQRYAENRAQSEMAKATRSGGGVP